MKTVSSVPPLAILIDFLFAFSFTFSLSLSLSLSLYIYVCTSLYLFPLGICEDEWLIRFALINFSLTLSRALALSLFPSTTGET